MPMIGWLAFAIRRALGRSRPAISRSDVVLAQPDGPRKEWKAPRLMAKDTSSTAASAPKRLLTCSKTISLPAADDESIAIAVVTPPSIGRRLPCVVPLAFRDGS